MTLRGWTPPPPEEEIVRPAPLTTNRITLPERPGQDCQVTVVARDGLAREVLLGRAVPLLHRARYLADRIADIEGGGSAEQLADDIAALVGHSVTDQPPADELEAVLADGMPGVLTWEQIESLPRDMQALLPATAIPTEPAVPAETPAERRARHEEINDALEGMGITLIPLCPMAPYAEQVEPPPGPDDDASVAYRQAWEAGHAAAHELPPHNYLMPHRIGSLPAFASREETAEWEDGVDGCPPGCPRRVAAESREPAAPAARRLAPGDDAWIAPSRRRP